MLISIPCRLETQHGDARRQLRVLSSRRLQFAGAALDDGQGHTLPVDRVDMPIIGADSEEGREILRHGADVAGGL